MAYPHRRRDDFGLDDFDYIPADEPRSRPRARTLGRDDDRQFADTFGDRSFGDRHHHRDRDIGRGYEAPKPKPTSRLDPWDDEPVGLKHRPRPSTMYEPEHKQRGRDYDTFEPRSRSHAGRKVRGPSPLPYRRAPSPDPLPKRRESHREKPRPYEHPRDPSPPRRRYHSPDPAPRSAKTWSHRQPDYDDPYYPQHEAKGKKGSRDYYGYEGDPYRGRGRDTYRRPSPSPERGRAHHRRGESEKPHRKSKSDGKKKQQQPQRARSSSQFFQRAGMTALRAGAQAAYKMKDDPADWREKGIKVGTAAVGAALVDSFMGERHPKHMGGFRHAAMREAADLALGRVVGDAVSKAR